MVVSLVALAGVWPATAQMIDSVGSDLKVAPHGFCVWIDMQGQRGD